MGDAADMMLDGILDSNGEYNPKGSYFRGRTESKAVKKIRKELALLINKKHQSCITEKQKNAAVNEARYEINLKYGHDWRNL